MIQAIGILLCFYLVFKGYEILQIAICSPRADRGWALGIGTLFFLASIVLAVVFALMFISTGSSPQIPPLTR
jgi:hypothetical protein